MPDNILILFGGISFFVFASLAYAYRKINRSILIQPMIMNQLTFGITIFTVLILWQKGSINNEEFITIFIQCTIFYIVWLMAPAFVSKKLNFIGNENFSDYFKPQKIDNIVYIILFVIFLIINIYSLSAFWSKYTLGDQRLIFARENRFLNIFQTLITSWFSVLMFIFVINRKNLFDIIAFMMTFALILLNGSKGAALGSFLMFLFIYYNSRNKIGRINIPVILSILVLLLLPTYIMYGEGVIDRIKNRVLMSADIYLIAFEAGDYTRLIGFYDPLSYFLHPFTSVFGVRGYEFPMGAQILQTMGQKVTGMGPNAQLPVLNMVLFGKDLSTIIVVTFLWAFQALLLMMIGFDIFTSKRFPLFFRSIFFILSYTGIMLPFFEIGMYEFNIGYLFGSIMFYLFVLFFKSLGKSNVKVKM